MVPKQESNKNYLSTITPFTMRTALITALFCICTSLSLSAELITEMESAIKEGNIQRVERSLAKGCKPNALIPDEELTLAYREQTGDSRGQLGYMNLLMYACLMGEPDIVNQLIAAGADLRARSPYDSFTALHYACASKARSENKIAIIMKLIQEGVDLNARSSYPKYVPAPGDPIDLSPLMICVDHEDSIAAQLLLSAGADIKQRDSFQLNALDRACVGDSLVMVRFLLSAGANPNERDANGATALMTTAGSGTYFSEMKHGAEIIEALIKAGANVNAVDHKGKTALDYYDKAVDPNDEIKKTLLKYKAKRGK